MSWGIGQVNPSSSNHDNDGCIDEVEDVDDDNDGMLDPNDECPRGELNWNSTTTTDYDHDGSWMNMSKTLMTVVMTSTTNMT